MSNNLKSIDRTNFLLVIASCISAHLLSTELLIFSYAFIGPAHYLTEISWLHDRQCFTKKRYDFLLLALVTVIIIFTSLGVYFIPLFFMAIIMAFVSNWWKRIAYTFFCTSFFILFTLVFPLSMYFFILLPTLVHVLIFTAIFILLGALKNNSLYGYLTLAALFLCSLTFFFDARQIIFITEYGQENNIYAASIYRNFIEMIGIKEDSDLLKNVISFFGFVYTYHYLNWFSKTKVIRWNNISKKRTIIIVALYIISVSIYLYDYALGFKTLLFLSLLHVVLEFPLNGISIFEVSKILKSRLSFSNR